MISPLPPNSLQYRRDDEQRVQEAEQILLYKNIVSKVVNSTTYSLKPIERWALGLPAGGIIQSARSLPEW
jgi:transcriptional regulator of nitric oxide reductase